MDTTDLVFQNIVWIVKKYGKIHIEEVKKINHNVDFLLTACNKEVVRRMLVTELCLMMYYCGQEVQKEIIILISILDEDVSKNMELVENLDNILVCEDKYIWGWLEVLEYFFNLLK